MAVNLAELLALPSEQRLELAEVLLASAVPDDIEPLLREFVTRLERTNQTLDDLHDQDRRLTRVETVVALAIGRQLPADF